MHCMVQLIDARVERALNVRDYSANNVVDDEANSGSNDDHVDNDDDDEGSIVVANCFKDCLQETETASWCCSHRWGHRRGPGGRSASVLLLPSRQDAYARPSETLAPQPHRRLELSVVKDNIPVWAARSYRLDLLDLSGFIKFNWDRGVARDPATKKECRELSLRIRPIIIWGR